MLKRKSVSKCKQNFIKYTKKIGAAPRSVRVVEKATLRCLWKKSFDGLWKTFMQNF